MRSQSRNVNSFSSKHYPRIKRMTSIVDFSHSPVSPSPSLLSITRLCPSPFQMLLYSPGLFYILLEIRRLFCGLLQEELSIPTSNNCVISLIAVFVNLYACLFLKIVTCAGVPFSRLLYTWQTACRRMERKVQKE